MLYELTSEVEKLAREVAEIYIYGAGMYGKEVAMMLIRNSIRVEGFIVTDASIYSEVLGLKVINAHEVIQRKDIGIILGLNDEYKKEVINYMKEENVDFARVVDGGYYISKDKDAEKLRIRPTLEITAVLGCSVNCRYCPQKLLIKNYYLNRPDRKRVMQPEDFEIFLQNIPKQCDIMFAGMAEPYLNPYCTSLLKMACESGHNVSLYTTLEGATDRDIDELLKLPIQFLSIHVADECGYAHITLSESYYDRVQRLLNANKNNGQPFVNDVSAQAKPDSRIAEMCRGKYEVLEALHDRCGQLQGENISGREYTLTSQKLSCAFCGPDFNNHVVLPDGTLLLCNMDYGMKHVLGNLLEETFEELHRSNEMKRVMKGAMGDQSVDLLCRKCICAIVKKE